MAAIIVTCPSCGTKNRIPDTKQHLAIHCGRCKDSVDVRQSAIPIALDDATLDSFVRSVNLPVLIDFFSPSCGPCITLAPLLVEMTRSYLGKIIITKVDTSKNPRCADRYRVKAVPTLVFVRDGKVVDEIVGLPQKNYLQAKLDYYAG